MNGIFLGVQLVLDRRRVAADRLRAIPAKLRAHRRSLTFEENATLHREVAARMSELVDGAVAGYWDYLADPAKARKEYQDWCGEIEQASSPGPAKNAPFRASAGGPLCLVTGAWMLWSGSKGAASLGVACDVLESAYWRHATFRQVLGAVRALDFRDIQDDALYVVPGSEEGLPEAHVRGPGFEYLRPIG